VNLPANITPELIEHISQTLQETSLDACSLKLEITESAIMENFELQPLCSATQRLEVELHMGLRHRLFLQVICKTFQLM